MADNKKHQIYSFTPGAFNGTLTILRSLVMYIECHHADDPVLWFADMKTPVIDLPDFQSAKKNIDVMADFECQNKAEILTFEQLFGTIDGSVQKNAHFQQG